MSVSESARARLAHGLAHIDALREEIADVLHRSDARFRPQLNEGHLVLTVDDQSHVPTQRWGLMIGDAVVNLRAALDHMVWSLSVAHCGPAPVQLTPAWRGIKFPICLTQSTWFQATSTRRSALWALPPEIVSAIERLQPFASGRGRLHPLWVLNELANLNKHRQLPLLARRLGPRFLEAQHPIRGRLLGGRMIVPMAGTQQLARIELEAHYRRDDTNIPAIGDSVTSILFLRMDMRMVFGKQIPASGGDIVGTLSECADLVLLAIDELEGAHRQRPLFV